VGSSNPQTPNRLATGYIFLAKVLKTKHTFALHPIFIINSEKKTSQFQKIHTAAPKYLSGGKNFCRVSMAWRGGKYRDRF
jgi:hypothetical protein